jgi:hypothetical protein
MPAPSPSLWSRLQEVRDVLAFTFDFEAFEHPLGAEAYATPSPWLPAFVVPAASVLVVGRDAMGGAYVSCELSQGRRRCCLHVDTRGRFVPLGEDVEQTLALVIALPYWRELLDECPSGSLDTMRALAIRLEREACDDLPDLPAAREDLKRFLDLPDLGHPVERLHALALTQAEHVTVLSPHGWRYESPVSRVRTASASQH